ncbi:MAG: lipoprotein 17-related variable surface protein [Mycoplasma sp.]|nr:lipoprotein 17-related variable surface protein [Mycoplasma sp.]
MKKKFLLGLGSLSILATVGSVAVVASCGDKETDQDKVNSITQTMVLSALKLTPQATTMPSDVVEPKGSSLENLTINGVSGLSITISNWTPNDSVGTLAFNVTISKDGINEVPKEISSSGWKTGSNPANEQAILNSITGDDLLTSLKVTPDPTVFPPDSFSKLTTVSLENLTVKGVEGLKGELTPGSYQPDNDLGAISFSFTLSKPGLTSKTINVSKNGWITTSKNDSRIIQAATTQQLATALNISLPNPDGSTIVPSNPPQPPAIVEVRSSLGVSRDLKPAISNYNADTQKGIMTFDVTFIKDNSALNQTMHFSLDGFNKAGAETDQSKLNGITSAMLKPLFTTINPNNSTFPSDVPTPPDKVMQTLNNLDGLTVSLSASQLTNDDTGTLVFIATISKPASGLTDKVIDLTWNNWKTTNENDQNILNGFSIPTIKSTIQKAAPDYDPTTNNQPAPSSAPTITSLDLTEGQNTMNGINVAFSNYVSSVSAGTVSFDVTLTKEVGSLNKTTIRRTESISIDEFNKNGPIDQNILNGLTSDQMKTLLGIQPDPTVFPTAAVSGITIPPTISVASISGSVKVMINAQATPNDNDGSITFHLVLTAQSTARVEEDYKISGWNQKPGIYSQDGYKYGAADQTILENVKNIARTNTTNGYAITAMKTNDDAIKNLSGYTGTAPETVMVVPPELNLPTTIPAEGSIFYYSWTVDIPSMDSWGTKADFDGSNKDTSKYQMTT